jgi:hypothetical protein
MSLVALASPVFAQDASTQMPIIDMHLHAQNAAKDGQPLCLPVTTYGISNTDCDSPLLAPHTDDELVRMTAEILNRRNIYGVISGESLELVQRFTSAAPDRLIPAYVLNLGETTVLSPERFRRHVEAGDFAVLGEIENQYVGIEPGDPRMEAYWALAEELQIPVALHLGEAYPGAPYSGAPKYRVSKGSPLLLEDVLVRYPRLRIYVMHYGSPLVDEMIAVLHAYPNVYIDVGGNTWPYKREFFYSQLKKFMDAGFGKRVMFGSDQMKWPDLIEISIDAIEEAPFLSESEKRDIFYNNAARFLELPSDVIRKHHAN